MMVLPAVGGKMVKVNKGKWDESDSLKYKHNFNKKWIKECYRILKDDGTIWISGTLHNIYSSLLLLLANLSSYICIFTIIYSN